MTENEPRGRTLGKDADALDELSAQNGWVREMLDVWRSETARLEQRDDVHDRWTRGSSVKMLLQHLAVREAAKQDVAERLRAVGQNDLADRLEAEGSARRQAIVKLDSEAGGRQAITLNIPAVDRSVEAIDAIVRPEMELEDRDIIPQADSVLGESGSRGLPSSISVRLRSDVRPSPTPRWYDKVKPLKALISLFDQLRSEPSNAMAPGVDQGREHTPGP